MNIARTKFKGSYLAIIILAATTAVIHFYRASFKPKVKVLFTLNGVGYFALLVLLYVVYPLPHTSHRLILRILVAYTALTFAPYFVWSIASNDWVLPYDPIAKIAVALLLVLLWRTASKKQIPISSVEGEETWLKLNNR